MRLFIRIQLAFLKGETCISRRCSKETERWIARHWAEYDKIGVLSINVSGILDF